MFSNLMSKLFSHAGTAAPTSAPGSTSAPPAAGAPPAGAPPSTSSAPAPAPAAAPAKVDVAAILDGLAAKNSEKLDWKHSIVDMMKLLGMDSSLSARKELAKDLHYSGDMNDSAKMNIWLHEEVMRKLAANGGKVPADLLK